MNRFRIVVPLEPEGKARHRVRVVVPKVGEPWAQSYSDPRQQPHVEEFQILLRKVWTRAPLECPVLFGVLAFVSVPKSKPQWWKEAALRGAIRPTTKPDLSNVVKLAEDAANKILWQDDTQIVGYLQTGKFYSLEPKYVLDVQLLPTEQAVRQGPPERTQQLGLLKVA